MKDYRESSELTLPPAEREPSLDLRTDHTSPMALSKEDHVAADSLVYVRDRDDTDLGLMEKATLSIPTSLPTVPTEQVSIGESVAPVREYRAEALGAIGLSTRPQAHHEDDNDSERISGKQPTQPSGGEGDRPSSADAPPPGGGGGGKPPEEKSRGVGGMDEEPDGGEGRERAVELPEGGSAPAGGGEGGDGGEPPEEPPDPYDELRQLAREVFSTGLPLEPADSQRRAEIEATIDGIVERQRRKDIEAAEQGLPTSLDLARELSLSPEEPEPDEGIIPGTHRAFEVYGVLRELGEELQAGYGQGMDPERREEMRAALVEAALTRAGRLEAAREAAAETAEEMTGEGAQRQLPDQVGGLLDAVTFATEGQAAGRTGGLVLDVLRRDAIRGLMRQEDLDRDAAESRVDQAMRGVEDDAAAAHRLIEIAHQDTLGTSGLELNEDPLDLRLRVRDGQRLSEVLEAATQIEDEAVRNELTNRIGAYFQEFLDILPDYVLEHPESADRAREIFSQQEMPRPLAEAIEWVTVPSPETHSVREVIEHAPALANSIEALDGDEGLVNRLRQIAEFARDGDMVPSAIADELDLTPDRPASRFGEELIWDEWEEPEDWEPAFTVLEGSNPEGAFRPYLAQNLTELLNGQIEHYAGLRDQDYETYAQDWLQARNRAREMMGRPPSTSRPETIIRASYEANKAQAQSLVESLRQVRQRLESL